jgi:hypothetical protein
MAKRKAAGGKGRGDMMVVASKVKAFVKTQKLRCDGELTGALNGRVQELLSSAADRTRANKRGTVRPQDL